MPSKHISIYKRLGETPLQALERFRLERGIDPGTALTYAGRLDPMAEGELLILVGDECKNKDHYLGLDKEYEVEILFGIETDTYDILGLVQKEIGNSGQIIVNAKMIKDRYVGRHSQPYPPYSSKTVDGRQLHDLARSGELPDEMPVKEVEIYDIDLLNTKTIHSGKLEKRIIEGVSSVKGDFRQSEIIDRWRQILAEDRMYTVATIRVRCSSGTYMRSLAHRIGEDIGNGACALAIRRVKIFL